MQINLFIKNTNDGEFFGDNDDVDDIERRINKVMLSEFKNIFPKNIQIDINSNT